MTRTPTTTEPRCDGGWPGCAETPVAYIDRKGYAYCASCGPRRQSDQACRKLRPNELARLRRGEPLRAY